MHEGTGHNAFCSYVWHALCHDSTTLRLPVYAVGQGKCGCSGPRLQ